jgi:acyl-CoA thioester hydrolase
LNPVNPGSKKFSIDERVRWSDVDRAGIIYFGSYVRFFEIAETEMFRAMGFPFSVANEVLDMYPVRRQFHVDFHSPAYLDDLVRAYLWVSHVGNSSLRLDFEMDRHLPAAGPAQGKIGERLVTGHCVLVSVDRTHYRPVPIPELLRSALGQFLIEDSSGDSGVKRNITAS